MLTTTYSEHLQRIVWLGFLDRLTFSYEIDFSIYLCLMRDSQTTMADTPTNNDVNTKIPGRLYE